MKMRYYILGIMAMGMLLFGAFGTPVLAQEDPFAEGPPPGTYSIEYDINLVNNWLTGPTPMAASDLVNTNLYYNVTKMISPLDEYFNVGFFMPGGEGYEGPEWAIDGTFENSKVFVKIVNDQITEKGRLLDIQAAMSLGEDVIISWRIPEGVEPPSTFPIDMLPSSFTLPAGSGTPPFPVIKMATNFSQFETLNDWFYNYGYEGLPFFAPSIIFLDDLSDAFNFWINEVVIEDILPFDTENEDINFTTTVTPVYTTDFDLTIELIAENDTADFGNFTLDATWSTNGFLSYFSFDFWMDFNENGILESNEHFYLEFDLYQSTQDMIPVSVGDKGEYLMDVALSLMVDLENETLENMLNEMLTAIVGSINELDGNHLLNYTITSMDGLYYTIDGYMFDLGRFMSDRLPFFNGGTGAQEPLPPIEDYYMPMFGEGGDHGYREIALNMFDAGIYANSTSCWEVRDGYYWYDQYGYENWDPLYAEDENSTWIPYTPGVVNAIVFDREEWNMYYNWDKTFLENVQDLLPSSLYNGPVEYREFENTYYDPYDMQWYNDTYHETWIVDNSSPFNTYTPYLIVLEIQEMPGTGYTTYIPEGSMWNMFMMPIKPMGGLGAQDSQTGPMFGIPIDPKMLLPLPVRTPDWEVVGGLPILVEAIMDAMNNVLTNPDFLAMLTGTVGDDPGDAMVINAFNFGMNWNENVTHAGMDTFLEFNGKNTDNDTSTKTIVEIAVSAYNEEYYFWKSTGSFDSMGSYSDMTVNINAEDWPTPTTTPPTTTPTTTTTTIELTPGFEGIFIISGLLAIPIFFKKRR
ncbi:hypothetical protein [Candidatus Hodarchaeum mangrovi]